MREPGLGRQALDSDVNFGPADVMMTFGACAPEGVMMLSDRTQAPGLPNDPPSARDSFVVSAGP